MGQSKQKLVFINLFGSIINNDTRRGQILKKDAAKEQQVFDTMKEDFWIAKKNAIDRKYFLTRININQNGILTKRELRNNNSVINTTETIPNQTPFLTFLTHKYRLVHAIWVIEDENQTLPHWWNERVCHLKNEEKLQLCRETMVYPIAIQHKVRLVEGQPVGDAKNYLMRLTDPIIDGPRKIIYNPPPVVKTACLCPTDPPIYLNDFSDGGNYLDAYIAGQQKYGQEPDRNKLRFT